MRFLSAVLCVMVSVSVILSLCGCNSGTAYSEEYYINSEEVKAELEKIKNEEYLEAVPKTSQKLESAHLVLDTSYSVSSFLDDQGLLTTYPNILMSLADVFSGTSLTCYESPEMNTGSSQLSLKSHSSGAARIDDWRSTGFYSQFYQGNNNGTNLYGLMEAVVNHMNTSTSSAGNLYVIISDITPQPIPGSTMTSEDQLNAMGKLLVDKVILKEGMTFGIIGIQSYKNGDLYGMPDRSSGLAGNPYKIPAADLNTDSSGRYKTPIYLMLMGDEKLVAEYAQKIEQSITDRINPEKNEIKSYIVQKLEVRPHGILDSSKSDVSMDFPDIFPSDEFAPYAIGIDSATRSNTDHIFSPTLDFDYVSKYSIPFLRLFNDYRYDGENAQIDLSAEPPYSVVLMPEEKIVPLKEEYLDVDNAKISIKHLMGASSEEDYEDYEDEEPSGEQENNIDDTIDNAEVPITDLIERQGLRLLSEKEKTERGFTEPGAVWNSTFELKPANLQQDQPVMFITQTSIPISREKAYDFAADAVSDNAEWLFSENPAESWAVDIPEYWKYRENGGQYSQESKTPFLSTLFTTIRNEVAKNISEQLHEISGSYTYSSMFGVVVRMEGDSGNYYFSSVKNPEEDPDNWAVPNWHTEKFTQQDDTSDSP